MLKDIFITWGAFWIMTVGSAVFAQGDGDQYVLDSQKILLAMQTIESDLRIETFVDGKAYTSIGRYEEQALSNTTPNTFLRSMYRLEVYFSMNSPMPNDSEPNRMTLVCHPSEETGKNQITRYTSIEGVKSFSTVNLTTVERRFQAANREAMFAQISEVKNWGGLSGMMRQICRFYKFSTPTQETLHDEQPILTWKLTGAMQNIHIKELLPRFGDLDKEGRYPADFPSDVEIWLGQHDYFPYRIRYLRRTSEKSTPKQLLFQESFYKVTLNGTPLPASKFAPLTPPEGVFSVQDDTENFIRVLGL